MTEAILFRNATVIDGTEAEARPGQDVRIEGGVIREVSATPLTPGAATVIDLAGKTLMPGLIDCHVHVVASLANLGANARLPSSLTSLRAMHVFDAMLMREFTSVRDAGGADFGLKLAIEEGIVRGPRLFISGKALSQTGGHGDFGGRFDDRNLCPCCPRLGNIARVVDGVDDARRAVREEMKAGADQIKIMASGGIASPTDPIDFMGYSKAEIEAIVEEARNARTYVMAHAYTAEAITRAVSLGVRTIEHGNLIDDDAAGVMARAGAYMVPTLATYEALANEGAAMGFPAESVAKIEAVRGAGLEALAICRKAGVKMAFGSDLLADMHRHQSSEFALRAQVLPNHEVIRAATSVAAEVLRMNGKLGVVAAGAFADLIVVDGDPLTDITVLGGQGDRLDLITKAGAVVKNRLT